MDSMNGLFVKLRFRIDIIGEKLISSFGFNRTGWSLAFNVNGNIGQVQVQVREGSPDLTKAVIEAVSKKAFQLG